MKCGKLEVVEEREKVLPIAVGLDRDVRKIETRREKITEERD